jgi:tRNA threonylcarbamoyladenosine biosynthesis protein TsaB
MPIILNIDTATEVAHVSLSKDGIVLQSVFNYNQKDHAAFLQPAVLNLLKNTEIVMADIDAVAVTEGPGSYTGLRVGMASAKGICYAVNKPLVLINTLEVLAASTGNVQDNQFLLCPMLDARRMEVYTAVYNNDFDIVLPSSAMVLDENSFADVLATNKVLFFGSGSSKWKTLCNHTNATFVEAAITATAFAMLSYKYFEQAAFANLAYSQPGYLKEFHDTADKKK